jgi:hypothetical protein
MAPKAKETHAQRAARLARKSLELQHRDIKLKILDIIKEKPDVLPKLKDFLISLGVWVAEPDGGKETPSTGSLSGNVETPTKLGSRDPNELAEGPSESPEDENKCHTGKIHKNFNRLENMPLVHIKRWLAAMEPISLSDGQLKASVQRGSREASRERLAEIMEFTTGVDPMQPIFTGKVGEEQIKAFEDKLRQLNLSRGQPCLLFVHMCRGPPKCAKHCNANQALPRISPTLEPQHYGG